MGACGSKRTSAAAEDDWPAAPPPASRDAERAHASGIVRYESASQSSMTRMHAAASSQLPTSNIDSVSSGTPIDHVASRSTSAQTGVEQQRSSTSEAPSPYPTSAVNEAHPTTPPESPAPPSDNDASHIKTSDANQTEPPNLDAISGDELLRVTNEALQSVQLEELSGTEIAVKVARVVTSGHLPIDDGTFRAPAEALMRLFDDDRDGLLTGDEVLRMLLSFAEPMAAHARNTSGDMSGRRSRASGDSDGDGDWGDSCTVAEIDEAVRSLHATLLECSGNRGAVDVDDVELFLEKLDEEAAGDDEGDTHGKAGDDADGVTTRMTSDDDSGTDRKER